MGGVHSGCRQHEGVWLMKGMKAIIKQIELLCFSLSTCTSNLNNVSDNIFL